MKLTKKDLIKLIKEEIGDKPTQESPKFDFPKKTSSIDIDKELAKDIAQIVSRLPKLDPEDFKAYKSGEMNLKTLIQIANEEYLKVKMEELKNILESEKQLIYVSNLLKEKI